jgi:mannose/fructose/N-acetylgalactosamine-specific phosphotransferase system component IIC
MNWWGLALLGGFVGLDSTSFPQVMISRPLVAGALTGLLLGRPAEGVLIGAILEIFDLAVLPIGAARYPESGTATVAATVAFLETLPVAEATAALLLAVVFGLAWERVAGASVVLHRKLAERILFAGTGPSATARTLERRHLAAMAFDFVRGVLICVGGAYIGSTILRSVAPVWAIHPRFSGASLLFTGCAVLAASIAVFGGWREARRFFLIGAACGSMILLLIR